MLTDIIIKSFEALSILGISIWAFLYYTGRLKYTGEREERRKRNIEKHGWLLIIGGLMCFISSLTMIILILNG
jgi:hypothetical protein